MLFGNKIYSTLRKNLSIVISLGFHSILLLSYLAYNLTFSNNFNINYATTSVPISIVNEKELQEQTHKQILQKNSLKETAQKDVDKNQNNNATKPTYIHNQVSYQDLISNDANSIPQYPLIAKINKWEGEVVLIVQVDSNGDVIFINIKQSSGHKVLDDTAQKAIKAWKIPNNTSQNITIEIPVMFKLVNK